MIKKEAFEEAKSLALILMDKGSYQIACSDEGLMQEEIESCLRLVISAIGSSRGTEDWALQMLRTSRVSFLCEHELYELAGKNRDVR